jgi:hypothetical protein
MIRKIIGDAITKVIDDVGEMFLKKPGGKTQRVTDPDKAKKMIGDGAKVVSQAPIRNARGLTAREREAISGLTGQTAGVARTISRGKTSIGELVKSGQRAKPKGMGDRKAVVPRPKPPAKRSQTVPVPTPKPRPPAQARPTPKPAARAGGSGGGRPPGTAPRPMPGARPGQRPPRIVGTTRGAQAGTAARQAAILAQIQKNLEDASKKGPGKAEAMPLPKSKPKKPARTPDTKKIDPKGRPKKTPDTKKIDPKGRPVSAGKNVGFGPKGNIFPSNAEERKALMRMYGGTGSAAAKRALKGLQGDIVGGKAAYDAAKRKRLATKKKAGGKLGKDFMSTQTRAKSRIYKAPKSPAPYAKPKIKTYKPKKTPGMTGKPASRIYKKPKNMKLFNKGGKVARQVKGFGAARRPKN